MCIHVHTCMCMAHRLRVVEWNLPERLDLLHCDQSTWKEHTVTMYMYVYVYVVTPTFDPLVGVATS